MPSQRPRAAGAVWYHCRVTLRRRAASLVWLAVVIALLGGLAMGSVAAARRTASSFNVFWAASNPSELAGATGIVDPLAHSTLGYDPAIIAKLDGLAHVGAIESAAGFDMLPLTAALTPLNAPGFYQPSAGNGLGSVTGLFFDQDRVSVVDGRLADPSRANEFVMTAQGASSLGYHVGETVPIGIYTNAQTNLPGFGTSAVKPIRILHETLTGLVLFSQAVVQDDVDEQGTSNNLFTPALTRQLITCCVNYSESGIQVRGAARYTNVVAAEVDHALPKGFPPVGTLASTVEKADRSIRPLGLALFAFGAIVALAALLIGGQLISRQILLTDEERGVLRAVGAGTATTASLGLIGVVGAVLLGSVGALATAVALSPIAPLGPVRAVYPTLGFAADWPVLGAGVAALVVGLTALAVVLGWQATPHRSAARRAERRPSALVRTAAAAGLSAAAVAGVHMAVGRVGRGRAAVPVRSAAVGMVMAIAALVATSTFAASLNTLVHSPALYGWNWTYALIGGADIPAHQAAVLLDGDPDVAAWSGVYPVTLALDGVEVPVLGMTPGAAVGPSILSGHAMDTGGQVVLGSLTIAQLHEHVGQTVAVTNPLGTSTALRIVGVAAFPAMGSDSGGSHTELGIGAVIPSALIPVVDRNPFDNPVPGPNDILVRLRPGVDRATAAARLRVIAKATSNVFNFGVVLTGVLRPAEIINFRTLSTVPAALAAGVGGGALIAFALTLVASVRRRRRELALLKVLGFTRRQVGTTVAWQSTTTVLLALVLGVPLGVVLGRWLWDLFARSINVVPSASVSGLWVAAIVLGSLVVANLIAALPAAAAGRTPPALALRAE